MNATARAIIEDGLRRRSHGNTIRRENLAEAFKACDALLAADLAYDNARKAMAAAKRANQFRPLSPAHPSVVRMHQASDHRQRVLSQLQQVAA